MKNQNSPKTKYSLYYCQFKNLFINGIGCSFSVPYNIAGCHITTPTITIDQSEAFENEGTAILGDIYLYSSNDLINKLGLD